MKLEELAVQVTTLLKDEMAENKRRSFQKITYIPIMPDGSIKATTLPLGFGNAEECFLILEYKEMAITQEHSKSMLKHINREGEVHDNYEKDGCRIVLTGKDNWQYADISNFL